MRVWVLYFLGAGANLHGMLRWCVFVLLFLALPLLAEEERISGSFKLGEARAFSGHEIEIKGRRIVMRDYRCPDPATERGRDAKALMNQFLRTNITCVMVREGAGFVGDCWANDKNVTDGMVGAGLCIGIGAEPSI